MTIFEGNRPQRKPGSIHHLTCDLTHICPRNPLFSSLRDKGSPTFLLKLKIHHPFSAVIKQQRGQLLAPVSPSTTICAIEYNHPVQSLLLVQAFLSILDRRSMQEYEEYGYNICVPCAKIRICTPFVHLQHPKPLHIKIQRSEKP